MIPIVTALSPAALALHFDDIVLDRAARSVARRAREVRLGPIEFKLLDFFLNNPGRVLSRQELSGAAWGSQPPACSRTIDIQVGRLRKALTDHKERDPIRTVRGAGYILGAGPDCVRAVPSAVAHTPLVVPQPMSRGDSLPPAKLRRVRSGSGVPRRTSEQRNGLPDIQIDRGRLCVRRLGRDLPLSPKPFAVLDLLISNPGRIFTREQIAKVVWGSSEIDLRTVDAMVTRLRKAINRGVLPDPIRTVLGVGYKFSELFEEQHTAWPSLKRKKPG
ncbi:MAG: winged helix-turn-helix domain-containing protein [Hyphomonadaceae bacterium]|nr:winged helix-turn-helix domain-containing protein [Hyphomonadaceae bacterium]